MALSTIIDEYRNLQGVNFSTLKYYLKTPAHFKYKADHIDEEDDETAFIIGRALHCLVLEPEKFQSRYAFLDLSQRPEPNKTFRSSKNKTWRTNMIESFKHDNKSVLTLEEMTMIQQMAEGMLKCPPAKKLLKGCVKEQLITWTDPDTGVECKALVDFHDSERSQVIHGDAKSMIDASPRGVSNFMAKYMTHVQLAFYGDGLSQVYKKNFDCPFIIALEKEPPYLCQPYFIDQKAIEAGRTIYKSLLSLHKKCKESGVWGGYESVNTNHEGVIMVDLPAWAYLKAEATEMLQNY